MAFEHMIKNLYVWEYWWDFSKWTLAQTSSALSSTWWGGIFFNTDWSKIYLTQFWNWWRLYECALSTPFDITTIGNFNKYISVTYPEDIHFSPDWTKLFLIKADISPYQLLRYTLTTPRDISTAVQDQSINRGTADWDRWLYITDDWKWVYISRSSSFNPKWLFYASLSTAWDLTTASTFTQISTTLSWFSIWFWDNGNIFLNAEENWTTINYHRLSTPYDITSITESGTVSVWTNAAGWMWFNDKWTFWATVWWWGNSNYIYKYTLR